jgi:hypothetical protein
MRKLLTVLAMIGTFATPAIASDHSLASGRPFRTTELHCPSKGRNPLP